MTGGRTSLDKRTQTHTHTERQKPSISRSMFAGELPPAATLQRLGHFVVTESKASGRDGLAERQQGNNHAMHHWESGLMSGAKCRAVFLLWP